MSRMTAGASLEGKGLLSRVEKLKQAALHGCDSALNCSSPDNYRATYHGNLKYEDQVASGWEGG